MKEIPILFSTPMVQAILEGRKTQTRRAAAVPYGDHHGTDIMDWHLSKHPHFEYGKWLYNVQSDVDSYNTFELKAKYGRPGDLLWVRETWQAEQMPVGPEGDHDEIIYRFKASEKEDLLSKWRPSIHMPKGAARIWLQVTDVRVERLQDISEKDAIAEGVEKRPGSASWTRFEYCHYHAESFNVSAQVSFRTLWEKINGADSWAANPWVWAISFKVLSTTGRPNV